jgi:amidase
MTDLARLTAIETASAVAAGEFSALEACDAAIARIEALDGPINAVIVRDFERGRDQAKARDLARARGERPPLLGVPMTVKESFAVGGLPATWGFEVFRDWRPTADGANAAALKAAGAVILGKSNVPVALADWQSVNPVYGRTNNPHDLSRSPGGSSGGSAAALAAGMVALELGSDIGGSIRIPAHFCGVHGIKPTWGIVPLHGHPFPQTEPGAPPVLSAAGPMARSTADLSVALDVLSEVQLARPRLTSLKGARLFALTSHPLAAASSAITQRIEAVLDEAARQGAAVTRSSEALPDLKALHTAYMPLLLTQLSVRNPMNTEPAPPLLTWLDMLDTQARMMRAFDRFFQEFDAIVSPVVGMEAFVHTDLPMAERTVRIDGADHPFAPQFAWISPATYACLPAVSMPLPPLDSGLPVNMQIITARLRDQDAIALAGMLGR